MRAGSGPSIGASTPLRCGRSGFRLTVPHASGRCQRDRSERLVAPVRRAHEQKVPQLDDLPYVSLSRALAGAFGGVVRFCPPGAISCVSAAANCAAPSADTLL